MRLRPVVTKWIVVGLLVATFEPGRGQAAPDVDDLPVLNLESRYAWIVQEKWLITSRQEFRVGRDLNGDGDTGDSVFHVRDLPGARTTNLGLASDHGDLGSVFGDWWTFPVSELAQGEDLNGDGDTGDAILHIHHLPTAETRNVALTGRGVHDGFTRFPEILADWPVDRLLLGVLEQVEDRDLNHDGDTEDYVAHLHVLSTGEATNLELDGIQAGSLHWLVHSVSEQDRGEDLNGDGDTRDRVLHAFDLDSSSSTNLGRAGSMARISGDWLAFAASERGEGKDLNGDGDTGDHVVHVSNLVTGETENLGLAVTDFSNLGHFRVVERHVIIGVPELSQRSDLNGDGDTGDLVLHVHEFSTGETTNLAVDGFGSWWVSGDTLVVRVREEQQGTDLNGDADLEDIVFHVHDLATRQTRNLGLAGQGVVVSDNDVLFESSGLLHLHERSSGETENLGLATTGRTIEFNWGIASEGWHAFRVGEYGREEDLNGDGDTDDGVLHLRDARTGRIENLRLDGYPQFAAGHWLVVSMPLDPGDSSLTAHLVDLRGLFGARQVPGDCNQDAAIDISDAICLFEYLFLSSSITLPCEDGSLRHDANVTLFDWQPDGQVDISDGIRSLQYLFLSGPPHPLGADCAPVAGCDDACSP